jgi:hypothetical protein
LLINSNFDKDHLLFDFFYSTYRIKIQNRDMKKIKLSTNFTVFLLFFGIAALEAFQTVNWIKSIFWVAIGIVFLVADNLKKA